MHLPATFKEKMKQLLQEEYDSFMKIYHEAKTQGLRLNPLKGNLKKIKPLLPFTLEPIPWTRTGYYYDDPDRPGKHPYHEAGLYYIQEPSAMAVGEFVEAKPSEWVLDLCAAPGGKTTHIAGQMKGEGILFTNEIHPTRVKRLVSNVERMGIQHAIVLNDSPENLAKRLVEVFDRVIVDAPCSGEGMFRKYDQAIETWNEDKVIQCARLQKEILTEAAKMVKPGGRLVFSTCTFSPEENEQVIEWFLTNHDDFKVEIMTAHPSFSEGRVEWTNKETEAVRHTFRLWPHRLKGEGHYIAVLRKDGDGKRQVLKPMKTKTIHDSAFSLYKAFAKKTLVNGPEDRLILNGSHVYRVPQETPKLDKLNVARLGVHLGENKKNRFEPSHAFAHILTPDDVKQYVNLEVNDSRVYQYLKGETIRVDQNLNGWVLVCVDGYSLGWGKASHGMLKNHYPKGLRWLNS